MEKKKARCGALHYEFSGKGVDEDGAEFFFNRHSGNWIFESAAIRTFKAGKPAASSSKETAKGKAARKRSS